MYDSLEDKRKLFEISKRDVSDVHQSNWVPEVSIEVGNSMDEQSNHAQRFQKEDRKCPDNCCEYIQRVGYRR